MDSTFKMSQENWEIMIERIQYLRNEVKKYKYDFLTGLKLRKDFDEYLRTLYEMYEFENREFTIVLIDINGLHTLNRTVGYTAGDDLIKGVSAVLVDTFKECNGSEVFRIGGDEFAILIKSFNKDRLESFLESIEHVTYAYTHVETTKDYGSPANVFKMTDNQIISKKKSR
jgi:diguanylate cyclase (GGDEF)-like protein